VLLRFTAGTGNYRSPCYLGNYVIKEESENLFDAKISKNYVPNGMLKITKFASQIKWAASKAGGDMSIIANFVSTC
jgi:hypothetical protein